MIPLCFLDYVYLSEGRLSELLLPVFIISKGLLGTHLMAAHLLLVQGIKEGAVNGRENIGLNWWNEKRDEGWSSSLLWIISSLVLNQPQ